MNLIRFSFIALVFLLLLMYNLAIRQKKSSFAAFCKRLLFLLKNKVSSLLQ